MPETSSRFEEGLLPGGSVTGGAVAPRIGQLSWAMFDWANQPFFTLVTTFIFAPYFAAGFVGDPTAGQALWANAVGIAGVAIALVSPVLGTIADQTGRRKPWLFAFSVIFCIAVSCLWFAEPGMGATSPWGIILAIAVASVALEFAVVFNNAMLPSLVSSQRLGALSGAGWGIGYLGGFLSLVMVVGFLAADRDTGLTLLKIEPWFGLDPAQSEADRASGPFAAIWYAVFVIPLFLFTPDQPPTGVSITQGVRKGLKVLGHTLASLGSYRNIALFLIARMFYYDGISAVFMFGGIYATGIFGWDITTLGIYGVIISIFAAVGAFLGGWVDDLLGSKATIALSVLGLVLSTVGIASIDADRVLFFIDVLPPDPDAAAFASAGERVLLAFSILIGVFGGPAQAASRTMLARIAPSKMMTEFFGLYALSGKATAFVAPFAIGWATSAYASQRAGLLVVVAFLILGLMLMAGVKEKRADAV